MQVPRHQAWDGVIASVANARDLIDAAKILSKQGFHGQAAALAVLSAEESSKAVALAGRFIEDSGLNPNLRPFFRDHRLKHHSVMFFLAFAQIMQEMMDEVVAIENDPAVEESDYGQELVRRSTKRLQHYTESDIEPVEGLSEWSDRADRIKQQGFYVNFHNGRWKTPRHLSEDECQRMFAQANRILTMLESFVQRNDVHEVLATMKEKMEKVNR